MLYFNTDGGTYVSSDGGASVQNLSLDGLGVGQFYSTHTSVLDPRRISGGTQDQGYQVGLLEPSFGAGPSTPFDQIISGDYGHLSSGDGTHAFVYSTYPGFVLIQVGETNPTLRTADVPAGADRLYRYTRSGSTWIPSVWSSEDFAAGSSRFLSALAFAPSDPQRAYAVTDTGRLYASTNGGVTWAARANGLPATLVHDLAWSPDGSGDLFAAAEAGAYHFDAATQTWTNAMGAEAPATNYWSVETVAAVNRVRFGTYGRGIWDLVLVDGDGPIGVPYCGPAIVNQSGSSAEIRATGSPFVVDGDLTLTASQLPPNALGYFIVSRSMGVVPAAGGSVGTLCLFPPFGRYVALAQSSGTAGSMSIPVDLLAVPQPTLSVAAQAGETWFFQAWFRDLFWQPARYPDVELQRRRRGSLALSPEGGGRGRARDASRARVVVELVRHRLLAPEDVDHHPRPAHQAPVAELIELAARGRDRRAAQRREAAACALAMGPQALREVDVLDADQRLVEAAHRVEVDLQAPEEARAHAVPQDEGQRHHEAARDAQRHALQANPHAAADIALRRDGPLDRPEHRRRHPAVGVDGGHDGKARCLDAAIADAAQVAGVLVHDDAAGLACDALGAVRAAVQHDDVLVLDARGGGGSRD